MREILSRGCQAGGGVYIWVLCSPKILSVKILAGSEEP